MTSSEVASGPIQTLLNDTICRSAHGCQVTSSPFPASINSGALPEVKSRDAPGGNLEDNRRQLRTPDREVAASV